MTDKPTNVIEALTRVSDEVGAIEKLRTPNAGPKYDYRGIEDVLNSLHGPLKRNGVVIVPRVSGAKVVERPNFGKDGGLEAQMTVEYRIYGPGGRDDYVDASVFATGIDTGDKGSGKAMSYAYKSLAFQLLCIPTDVVEDNEANPVPRTRPAEVAEAFQAATEELRKPEAKVSAHAIEVMAEVLDCDDPVGAPPEGVTIERWMWKLAELSDERLDGLGENWAKVARDAQLKPADILDRAQGLARTLKADGLSTAHVPDTLGEVHGPVAAELRRFLLTAAEPF